jgi:hypothetical protein
MQKLGTSSRSFISGNICFKFSVQCLAALLLPTIALSTAKGILTATFTKCKTLPPIPLTSQDGRRNYTDKKENTIFLIYEEIQMGLGA